MATQNTVRYSLIVLLGGLMMCSSAPAKQPEIQNKGKKLWVHRRDKDDPDGADALAVVMRIKVTGNTAIASIWKYKSYDSIKKEYTDRDPVIVATGTVNDNSPTNSRRRERITLMKDGEEVAYVTLYRGKSHGARGQQRLVLRWPKSTAKPAQAIPEKGTPKAGVHGGDCDEPPEDDPMEEEPIDVDPITEEPPPELEDPGM